MVRKIWILLLITTVCVSVFGCTCRNWYNGLQTQARQDCYRHPADDDVAKCLDCNDMSYDQYTRERKSLKDN